MAEPNCTNKQNCTIHGVGSADLHGVAESNCTNKLHYGWQNQTVQISKTIQFTRCTLSTIPTLHSQNQLYTTQPNTIQINLMNVMHDTSQACAGLCEECTDSACLQTMITEVIGYDNEVEGDDVYN